MELTTDSERWVLHLDRWITRRKRYHIVTAPDGAVMFRSRIVGECLLYLAAEDVECYAVVADPPKGQQVPEHEMIRRKPVKWQN